MGLFGARTEKVDPARALAGRDETMPVPERHLVLGTPLLSPFPEGAERITVGMGCSWGAERKFWPRESCSWQGLACRVGNDDPTVLPWQRAARACAGGWANVDPRAALDRLAAGELQRVEQRIGLVAQLLLGQPGAEPLDACGREQGGEGERHHQLDQGETVTWRGSHAADFRELRRRAAIGASVSGPAAPVGDR